MDTNTDTEQSDEGFSLPSEVLEGKEYKAGDTITLKVISVDPDGGCQVEVDDGEKEDDMDMMTYLRKSVPNEGEQ